MTSPSGEIPSHRACQHCRSQKVRCLPEESNPDICQRCARSGRPCVFTPLQKRKQRKRTDTRVAELEREMRAMRAALKQKEDNTRSSSPVSDTSRPPPVGLWYKEMVPSGPRLESAADLEPKGIDTSLTNIPENHFTAQPSAVPSLWPQRAPNRILAPSKDIIDSGLISIATARHLLDSYRNDLFPHYPTVPIPPSVTVEELRAKRPALFLAVIAAAAGKENPELSETLDREVLQSYANRSMVQSEKSLDLVQALLVSAVWYNPPSRFGQLKYYEYIHMAATIAMDIGIGTRPAKHRSKYTARGAPISPVVRPLEDTSQDGPTTTWDLDNEDQDTTNVASRRTFLACYIICVGVSISLRRPHMLRVTSYLRECVEVLEQSPSTVPTDRTIVAWAKLMMIAEELSIAFSYDDPGGIASITELRTQVMLKDFEHRLSTWYANVPEVALGTGSMHIMYYTVRLYLHEVALHIDHSPEDFRAPYQMGYIYPFPEHEQIPTQILAEAIAECISCAQDLLKTFIHMDPHGLRGLPVFSYVRVSFAAFVLAKLCLSATHPESRIGSVLDRSSLKVEQYLDRTILHVRNVVGTHPCRVPAIFLALLFKLRQWCLNPEVIEGCEEEPIITPGTKLVTDESIRESLGARNAVPSISSLDSSPAPGPTGTTPASQTDRYDPFAFQQTQSSNLTGTNASPSMNNMPTALNTAFPNDNMDLDGQLVQILGDLNAFTEGGLTGLDDWGVMPADLTGLGQVDMSNWQFPPSMSYDSTTT